MTLLDSTTLGELQVANPKPHIETKTQNLAISGVPPSCGTRRRISGIMMYDNPKVAPAFGPYLSVSLPKTGPRVKYGSTRGMNRRPASRESNPKRSCASVGIVASKTARSIAWTNPTACAVNIRELQKT
jgi:hypothetical protein